MILTPAKMIVEPHCAPAPKRHESIMVCMNVRDVEEVPGAGDSVNTAISDGSHRQQLVYRQPNHTIYLHQTGGTVTSISVDSRAR
jgi:Na+-translocating ferredoxin:NAD+ oxidoreductase RnfG subunit